MPISRRNFMRIAAVAMLSIPVPTLGTLSAQPANASSPVAQATLPTRAASVWCSCVDYVKRKIGTKDNVGNAKDMGAWLKRNGWQEHREPSEGAIVVMQPSFPGADPQWGHVGFVARRNQNSKTKLYKIHVRGANQGGRGDDAGCNNVSTVEFGTWFGKGDDRIRFYTRKR